MASLLTADVATLLTAGAARASLRKKAALALLRMLRKTSPDADPLPADAWAPKLGAAFDGASDPGLLLCLTTLALGLASRSYEGWGPLLPRLAAVLDRIRARDVTPDYTYYGLPTPWLAAKALRALQYFPPPREGDPVRASVAAFVSSALDAAAGAAPAKNPNKANALHGVAVEAAALALGGWTDGATADAAVSLLTRCVGARDANARFAGLEAMVRLGAVPAVAAAAASAGATVRAALRDADPSLRRRALDLLFCHATPATAPAIVDELLDYVADGGGADDAGLREDVALRAAVLAERFPSSPEWYARAVLSLVERAGDDAPADVWHSAAHVVASTPSARAPAATAALAALKRGGASDGLVCAAAFLVGEYGPSAGLPLPDAAVLLSGRQPTASPTAKRLILAALLKLSLADGTGAGPIASDAFAKHARAADPAVQQRAIECAALSSHPSAAAAGVAPLPPWEQRRSALLRRVAAGEGEGDEVAAAPAWADGDDGGGVSAGGGGDLLTVDGGGASVSATLPTVPAAASRPVDPLEDLLSLSVPPVDAPVAPAVATNGGSPPAPAPPAASMDPFDALPKPAAPVVPAVAAPAAPVLADVAPAAAPAAPTPPTPSPSPDTSAASIKLLTSDSGILHEDGALQLGVRCAWARGGGTGVVTLYLGNKAASPLVDVALNIGAVAGVAALLQDAPPSSLAPRQQAAVRIGVTATAPFAAAPTLSLCYSTVAITLPLPSPPVKFVAPPAAPVPRDAFFAKWRALPAAPQRSSARVERAAPLTTAAVDAVLSACGLGVQPGLDPDSANAVAAGSFAYLPPGSSPTAPPSLVPVMARVEVDAASGRRRLQVTVAADATGPLAAGLADALAAALKAAA